MPPLPEEYFQFWRLWTQGEYFACHEALEIAWRREENAERKQFFHGLIHCAVALVHVERGNLPGAKAQLAKAKAKLARFGDEYSGCDLPAILKFVEAKLTGM